MQVATISDIEQPIRGVIGPRLRPPKIRKIANFPLHGEGEATEVSEFTPDSNNRKDFELSPMGSSTSSLLGRRGNPSFP